MIFFSVKWLNDVFSFCCGSDQWNSWYFIALFVWLAFITHSEYPKCINKLGKGRREKKWQTIFTVTVIIYLHITSVMLHWHHLSQAFKSNKKWNKICGPLFLKAKAFPLLGNMLQLSIFLCIRLNYIQIQRNGNENCNHISGNVALPAFSSAVFLMARQCLSGMPCSAIMYIKITIHIIEKYW